MIVAQLERAGIVRREARRLRHARDFADAAELERYLHEYEHRYTTVNFPCSGVKRVLASYLKKPPASRTAP